jgi:hypothetical protein
MAIYIYLQCCKCKNSHKLHLYSFSFNQYEIFNNLCEHFNIKYTYITNFGFFTLGWSITLEVKVQCRKCEESYYNFVGKILSNNNLTRLIWNITTKKGTIPNKLSIQDINEKYPEIQSKNYEYIYIYEFMK